MNCKFCNRKLRSDNKSGHCHPKLREFCAQKYCSVCSKPLSRKNKGDTCRAHRTQSSHYKTYQASHRKTHVEETKEYKVQYRKDNSTKINKYYVDRRKEDPGFKLACNLRTRVGQILKGKRKLGSAVADLGCSVDELRLHLESKFDQEMTWENYGTYWDVDHIYPLSKLNLTDRDQFKRACHYSNLQPLRCEVNRYEKRDKTEWTPKSA